MANKPYPNSFGRIGVLAGGPSNEREISLRSGRAVHAALVREGLDAKFIDVNGDLCDIIKRVPFDVAFIALHGRFGEDGTVQRILERSGIPYTGSGPEASQRALDKIGSKRIFSASGLPTPDYVVAERGRPIPAAALRMKFPVVVKPNLEGSSIGLSVVRAVDGLAAAVAKALEYDIWALVEKYVEGRELTVGILDDEPLPVVEVVTAGGVYDYAAKYSDPATQYLVPAPLEPVIAARAQELGVRSHLALGCRSFSRVDMMLDAVGSLHVLEVNTIPGMTERSLLPKAAAAAGISFGALCVKLIGNAYSSTHGATEKS